MGASNLGMDREFLEVDPSYSKTNKYSTKTTINRDKNCKRNVAIKMFYLRINVLFRSSAFQLRNVSRIRKYLSRDASEQIIHSFISSRLETTMLFFTDHQLINFIASSKFKITFSHSHIL